MLINLLAGNVQCRLLVAYHPGKENYQAILGYAVGKGQDTQVIASLEYHSTHPGWHVHGCCSNVDIAQAGRTRPPTMKRVPDGKSYHRQTTFSITESDALRPAIEFFDLNDALNDMSGLH